MDFTFAAEEDSWQKTTVEVIDVILGGLAVLVGAMTYFVTLFLESGWINGTFFGLDEHFRNIWILVSNVVYFIFAGVIIWIAFMNIIGKGDKWELKQALPKFVIGVLIVPFSWFFVQFVLSLSAILTVSALTLPYDTFDEHKAVFDEVQIPTKCYINLAMKDKTDSTDTSGTGNKKDEFFYCADETEKLGDTLKTSVFGLVSIYTYGILNLDNIKNLLQEEVKAEKVGDIGDLLVKIVFNGLFALIYMLLIVTLGLVLAVRGIYLWIYIMISPVFGLMYFFDKNEGGGEGVLSKFNIKQFISLALVPVYVTLALSFGLLFIQTITSGITKPSTSSDTTVTIGKDVSSGNDTISIDKFSLTISGPVGTASTNQTTNIMNVLTTGGEGVLGTIGTLIVYLMGAAVFRISIMAAIRTSDITKAVTEPIYNFGNQVGSLVAKAPQYAPIFPGKMSMKGMETMGSQATSHYATQARDSGNKFMQKHGLFGTDGKISTQDRSRIQELTGKVKDGNINEDVMKGIDKQFTKLDNLRLAKDDPSVIKLVDALGEKAGVKVDYSSEEKYAKSLAKIHNQLIKNPEFGSSYKKHNFFDTDGVVNEADALNILTEKMGKTNPNNPDSPTPGIKSPLVVDRGIIDGIPNVVLNMKVDGKTILFETDGKIKDSSKDEFVEYLVGKTEKQVKEELGNEGFDTDDISKIIGQVKGDTVELKFENDEDDAEEVYTKK